jgi:protoheme IX farnesyltransferase
MLLATPSWPDWRRSCRRSRHLARRRGGGGLQLPGRAAHRSRMARTAWRPTARGQLTPAQALVFSAVLCAAGSAVLWFAVNPLTMWLTFATFIGYAVVYTVDAEADDAAEHRHRRRSGRCRRCSAGPRCAARSDPRR